MQSENVRVLQSFAEARASRAVALAADFYREIKPSSELTDAEILTRFPYWAYRDLFVEKKFLEWFRAEWDNKRGQALEALEHAEPIRGLGVQTARLSGDVL